MHIEDIILSNLEGININKETNVLIALSGGMDSMCLFHILYKLNFKITCFVVNHNLRLNSEKEALQVKELIESYSVGCEIYNWHGNINKNLESEARDARYDALIDYAKKMNFKYILTGHHENDQIETFIMNLERGSGLDGLCSMQMSKYLINGIYLIRPMLNIAKDNIINYISCNNITFFEDPTNADLSFKRNSIRSLMSNDDVLFNKRISLAISNLQMAKLALDYYHTQEIHNIIQKNEDNSFIINRDLFLKLPKYSQVILLFDTFKIIAQKNYKGRRKSILMIINKIKNLTQNKIEYSNCTIKMTLTEVKIIPNVA